MNIRGILTGVIFFLAQHGSAQSVSVEWGELEQKSGYLVELLPFHSKDFYSLRWKGGSLLGGYYLTRHDNLQETKSEKVSISINNNIANFEAVAIVQDHPVAYFTDNRDGKEQIFMQQYGYDLLPRGEAHLLAEFILDKGHTLGQMSFIQSNDKKYFGALWLIVGKKKDHDVYGYVIYNDQMELVHEGEYEIPFQSQYSEITDHLLTNTGDYFVTVKEFEPSDDKRVFRSFMQYRAMHIYQVHQDGLEDYTIPMRGKRVEALTINSDDTQLFTLTGVYGENQVEGVKGIFYMKLDYRNQEVKEEGFEPFDKNFITEDWSEKELDRAQRREEKGKGEAPTLFNYQMRDVQVLDDGSIVGSMEQHYVFVRSTPDSRGMITTSYTYYYNDIIAFRIGQSGGFDWLKKIKKMQVSTNDGGPYSSYVSFVDSNSMKFIFNDNVENYDANGIYLKDYAHLTKFTKKSNVVGLAEIDLNTGEMRRKSMFSRKETGTLAIPKMFAIDYNALEMLIYTTHGNKERYGLLRFN